MMKLGHEEGNMQVISPVRSLKVKPVGDEIMFPGVR